MGTLTEVKNGIESKKCVKCLLWHPVETFQLSDTHCDKCYATYFEKEPKHRKCKKCKKTYPINEFKYYERYTFKRKTLCTKCALKAQKKRQSKARRLKEVRRLLEMQDVGVVDFVMPKDKKRR